MGSPSQQYPSLFISVDLLNLNRINLQLRYPIKADNKNVEPVESSNTLMGSNLLLLTLHALDPENALSYPYPKSTCIASMNPGYINSVGPEDCLTWLLGEEIVTQIFILLMSQRGTWMPF